MTRSEPLSKRYELSSTYKFYTIHDGSPQGLLKLQNQTPTPDPTSLRCPFVNFNRLYARSTHLRSFRLHRHCSVDSLLLCVNCKRKKENNIGTLKLIRVKSILKHVTLESFQAPICMVGR
jgi:hypothetical protein